MVFERESRFNIYKLNLQLLYAHTKSDRFSYEKRKQNEKKYNSCSQLLLINFFLFISYIYDFFYLHLSLLYAKFCLIIVLKMNRFHLRNKKALNKIKRKHKKSIKYSFT